MSDIIQVNPLVFGGEGEAVHANMFVKLWENPNPSASFGPQTITLASDDYDFTLTIARRVAAYQQDICAITPKGDTVVINVGVAGGSGVTCAWRRLDYVSDTSLSAIDCKTATGTGAATTDNTQLIPIAIYGFKKSIDITAIVSEVSTDATKCIMSDGVTSVEDAISDGLDYANAINVTVGTPFTPTKNGIYIISGETSNTTNYLRLKDDGLNVVISVSEVPRASANSALQAYVNKGRSYTAVTYNVTVSCSKFIPYKC